MSDTIGALTVVLEPGVREEEARRIAELIGAARGVLSVDAHVTDVATHIAAVQERAELRRKLIAVLWPEGGAT